MKSPPPPTHPPISPAQPQLAATAVPFHSGAQILLQDPKTGQILGTLMYQVLHPMYEPVLAQNLVDLLAMKSKRVQPVTGADAQKIITDAGRKPS